jgi:transposase
MKAYSSDLRERIVQAVHDGQSQPAAARTFAVSPATVKRYMAQYRRTGSLVPKRSSGRPPHIRPADHPALRAQLAAAPAATLAEHCATWEQSHGMRVSVPTMYRAIRAVAWTRKKGR